jgi:hypothetical protein
MKKVLLIGFVVFCIFQMMVMAAAIDVGSGAINRDGHAGNTDKTMIDKGNTANASGTITSVEIWAYSNMTDVEVATFYVVSGNNLSTRGTHTIGSVTSGSKQTFSDLSIAVEVGDYLGIRWNAGDIEMSYSIPTGLWHLDGDYIPCSDQTFTSLDSYTISLYGTGATASSFALVKFNDVTITKWNEIAITKWNNMSIP